MRNKICHILISLVSLVIIVMSVYKLESMYFGLQSLSQIDKAVEEQINNGVVPVVVPLQIGKILDVMYSGLKVLVIIFSTITIILTALFLIYKTKRNVIIIYLVVAILSLLLSCYVFFC